MEQQAQKHTVKLWDERGENKFTAFMHGPSENFPKAIYQEYSPFGMLGGLLEGFAKESMGPDARIETPKAYRVWRLREVAADGVLHYCMSDSFAEEIPKGGIPIVIPQPGAKK